MLTPLQHNCIDLYSARTVVWLEPIRATTSGMAPSRGVDQLHAVLCWLMIASGAVVMPLLLLSNISARYGRYLVTSSRQQPSRWWGPIINAKLAWVTQEVPCLLVPLALSFAWPPAQFAWTSPRTWLTAAFIIHYTHRSLVYPWRLIGGKGTALAVWSAALLFCTWNGFLQGWFLLYQLPANQPWQGHHVIGLLVWAAGLLANLQADSILRNHRAAAGDTGYKIPYGGMFHYVSAANYTAETVEWAGYAIAGWSLAPATFAWATVANLAPRAAGHHKWYKDKFKGEYPETRKAFIPFVW